MNKRLLIIGAFVCYFVLLLGFIAFYLTGPSESAITMAGAMVSSAMMLLVVIFAVLFTRKTASEEYRERYLQNGNGQKEEEKESEPKESESGSYDDNAKQ